MRNLKKLFCLVLGLTISVTIVQAHYPDWGKLIFFHDYVALENLKSAPKRDLKLDPVVSAYLAQHPVYISLTTSPKRIKYLHHVLDLLDLENVTEILLALPDKFGRNGQSYEIPENIKNFPKLKILRMAVDLGPISKMLPALDYSVAIDPGALVISIDDDIAYARGMVNELLFHLIHENLAVVGGQTPFISSWGVDQSLWPFKSDPGLIIEGWAGIGFKSGEINGEFLRYLSQLSNHTYNSDDLVISYALGLQGIRKLQIRNEFYDSENNRFFAYGMEEDALHSGAGLNDRPDGLGDYNPWKYTHSLIDMNEVIGPYLSNP